VVADAYVDLIAADARNRGLDREDAVALAGIDGDGNGLVVVRSYGRIVGEAPFDHRLHSPQFFLGV